MSALEVALGLVSAVIAFNVALVVFFATASRSRQRKAARRDVRERGRLR